MEAVEELLRHKAAVNVQNNLTGATPLHCVVQSMKGVKSRRMQCMDLLIANGADVSQPDMFGKVAAEYCQDDREIAKKLQPQNPALFQAIDDGKVEEVKKLLSQEKKSNDDNNNIPSYEVAFLGETPFQHALNLLLEEEKEEEGGSKSTDRSQLVGILKVLLDAGVNINTAVTEDSNNPMQAMENPILPPLFRVCEALQNAYKGKEATKVLEETCQLLLQHKATVTSDLEQLLHTACRKNELQFAKLLIDVIQIDPNVKGRQGMTPLQFAARSGRTQVVSYLLSLPTIDIAIADDRGQTALDAAKVNNKQEVVALLEGFLAKK